MILGKIKSSRIGFGSLAGLNNPSKAVIGMTGSGYNTPQIVNKSKKDIIASKVMSNGIINNTRNASFYSDHRIGLKNSLHPTIRKLK